ncbi:unnamed protein product [marine sediment metagenome]|uniref:Uncharacterized protein n=1 Tax=marine sediment metagenome TaxID=412755 RepID=X0Z1W3_9ZZZZ
MPSMNTPGVKALDVWDVLITQITKAGSIGELLDDYAGHQLTPYSYGPTNLAGPGSYIPPANTIVFIAHLVGASITEDGKFYFYDGDNIFLDAYVNKNDQYCRTMVGLMFCDGTNKFSNGLVTDHNLILHGVTMA